MVAPETPDAKRRQSRLPRAREIAEAAQREVLLGNCEAVVRLGQYLQALAGLLAERILIDEHARRLVLASADSPAQLVELREAEPLRVPHQHDGGIRDVDSDFDHRGRDRTLDV